MCKLYHLHHPIKLHFLADQNGKKDPSIQNKMLKETPYLLQRIQVQQLCSNHPCRASVDPTCQSEMAQAGLIQRYHLA